MPGWPNRISRASLGPTLEDTWPVTDERKEIPARTFNLKHWQIAGGLLAAARAAIIADGSSGASITTQFQAIAWDPDGLLPKLAWTRISLGVFEFEFPQTQYPDESGNLVTLAIPGGAAFPIELNGSNMAVGQVVMSTGKKGRVHVRDIVAPTMADLDFLMLLW